MLKYAILGFILTAFRIRVECDPFDEMFLYTVGLIVAALCIISLLSWKLARKPSSLI